MAEDISASRNITPGPYRGWDEDVEAARLLLEVIAGGMRLSSLQKVALSQGITTDELNRSRQALQNLGWATEPRGTVIRLTDKGIEARRQLRDPRSEFFSIDD